MQVFHFLTTIISVVVHFLYDVDIGCWFRKCFHAYLRDRLEWSLLVDREGRMKGWNEKRWKEENDLSSSVHGPVKSFQLMDLGWIYFFIFSKLGHCMVAFILLVIDTQCHISTDAFPLNTVSACINLHHFTQGAGQVSFLSCLEEHRQNWQTVRSALKAKAVCLLLVNEEATVILVIMWPHNMLKLDQWNLFLVSGSI